MYLREPKIEANTGFYYVKSKNSTINLLNSVTTFNGRVDQFILHNYLVEGAFGPEDDKSSLFFSEPFDTNIKNITEGGEYREGKDVM